MSSITFKPIVKKGGMRKDGTYAMYIRVTFKGASRWLPTNLVCRYPDDFTRSLNIKNNTILDKAQEIVNYMRSITSDINIFALVNLNSFIS